MSVSNKAQDALQGLLAMQGETQDAAANLAKLQDQRASFGSRSAGDDAEFDTPKALATAVGAGFILGPAGGLLMGLAQGILGKQEKQNALDRYAADSEAIQAANQIYDDELDRLATTAENENDLEQLSGLQSKRDAATKLMMSGSPELQQQGQAMFAEFGQELTAYAAAQETQRIDAEVRQAQIARDLNTQQQSNFNGLIDDYDRQSANYEQLMLSSNQALELIARGNPVDIVAALIAVNKTLDPTSVVRPEEAKALVAGGDIIEQWSRKLNEWAGEGVPLGVQDRKELMQMVSGLRDQARGFQMQRDIRFQQRAVDLELPSKYVQHFRLVDDLPAFKPGEPEQRQGPISETLEKASNTFSDQNIVNSIVDTLGLDNYQPRSLDEMAKTNPRVRRAIK